MSRVTAAYLLAVLSAVLLMLGAYSYGRHVSDVAWQDALSPAAPVGIVITP